MTRTFVHLVSGLALAAVLAAGGPDAADALELPDQLRMDFPGSPPERSVRDTTDRPPEATGFDYDSGDIFDGIPSGGEMQRERTDQRLNVGTEPGTIGSMDMGTFSRRGGGPQRLRSLPEELQVSGRLNSRYSASTAQGNAQMYGQQFSDTEAFTNNASLLIHGPLISDWPIYVNASARARPYGPTDIEWSLTWHERQFDATYGDISANISRNSFATIQRQTKGLSIVGDLGSRGSYQLFGTESRGISRRETIPGEGTPGPYYLTYTPVREETIKLRIDEQDIPRNRYRFDPDQGMIYFEEIIVAQTSVIEVVYEENRAGTARGLYYGGVLDYRLGKLPLSVTYISQDISGGTESADESVPKVEEFIPNNSTGPFSLSYRPIDTSKPIVAYVDGIARREGVDFEFNRSSGVVQFFDIIPATSTVRIEYYYFREDARADTRKTLLGIDTGYRFGNLSLGSSVAISRGGLLSDGSPASGGTAWNLRGNYSAAGGDLLASATYQSQDQGFSRIESNSFDTDYSGLDTSIRYRASDKLTTFFRYSNTLSRRGLTLGAGESSLAGESASFSYRNEQWSTGGSFTYGSTGAINATVSNARSSSANAGSSTRNMVSAAWSDRFGNITTSAAATRSDRTTYRPSSGEETEEPSRTHTRSDTAQASLGYTWGGTNRATLSWSDSSTRDLLGTELDSGYSSLSGSVSYVPTDGLTILLNRSRSASSGATYLSTSVIDGGLDDDIDGGIDDGLDGDTDLLSNRDALLNRAWNRQTAIRQIGTGTNLVQARTFTDATSVSVSYRPSRTWYLGVSAREDIYESEGGIGYLSDQRRRMMSVDAGWDPSDSLRVSGSFNWSETSYTERSRGVVRYDGWGMSLSWRPSRDLSMAFGYDTSSALSPSFRSGLTLMTPTAYDNLYVEADWSISEDGRLTVDLQNNRNRGAIDDSDRLVASLSYSHRLNDDVSLAVGGRYVDFDDRLTPIGETSNRTYSALTYWAELRLGF